ncbi:aquaporin-4 isoform X2 [Globicephala melas]|uniref:aquaporin-4 isoform X2 n=1 Tax=Globicephala melas TaxID=9731 RepID=UPI0038736574
MQPSEMVMNPKQVFLSVLIFGVAGLLLFMYLQVWIEEQHTGRVEQKREQRAASVTREKLQDRITSQNPKSHMSEDPKNKEENLLNSERPIRVFTENNHSQGEAQVLSRITGSPTIQLIEKHQGTKTLFRKFSEMNWPVDIRPLNKSLVTDSKWRRIDATQEKRRSFLQEFCKKYGGVSRPQSHLFHMVSRIYVEDKHKILYCEVPKAGCSNWKRILMVLNGLAPSAYNISHDAVHYGKHLKKLDSFDLKGIYARLNTYTKAVFVRDPMESKCGPLCRRESIMVAFKGVWTQAFWKAVTAEFLAMLIFVLLSLGSTINWGGAEKPLPVDMVLISLCFGLSIATMVQCFGHISGGHINPAVTVAMVCTRKISIAKSVFYIAAQCLGAIIGAGILYLVTPPSVVGGLGVTTVHGNLSAGHGLLVELIITFQLVFTIFASCDSKRTDVTGSIALAIGFSVAIGHLFAIYWAGPIIGAVLAGGLYEYVFCPDVELKRRFKEAFNKAAQQTKGSYMEVEDNRSQVETDDLILKPGVVHVIDIDRGEEKKGKDPSGEVLSSV